MSRWEALEQRIDGDVALPGSPAYAAFPPTFNARFHDVRPQAIVSCAGPHDASEALSFARQHRLDLALRSGGHSHAGQSSSRGIVIDVTPMRSVSVSGGITTVGTGARLGEVYEALQEHGVAIPAGTCPSVGVAGLTLGGGLGILGRAYGVTSDSLEGAQIVMADGRTIECDEHHHEDLFWALRGAGTGTFGVVTSLVFRTVPAPDVTNIHLSWSFSEAAAVIEAWQDWAPMTPDGLAASLKVTDTGDVDRALSVDLYAALLGTVSDADPLLDALVAAASDPVAATREHMAFPETRRFWAQLGEAGAATAEDAAFRPLEPVFLCSKSEFFRRALPAEGISALLETFQRERVSGQFRELDFMPWGGAYNRLSPDATAFVHREELFLLKHSTVVEPDASPSERNAAQEQVRRSWRSVHRWGAGRAFQNFADPDLNGWAEAYYGPNLGRLVEVKMRYDPDNVFRFDQS